MPTAVTATGLDQLTGLSPLADTTVCADPRAVYAQLRQRWGGGQLAPVELEPGIPAWLVMGYPEIRIATREEEYFARNPEHWRLLADGRVPADSALAPMMFPRPNAYFADGATHQRLRAPLVAGLDGLNEHRTTDLVEATCQRLIARMPDHGEIDLVAHYAAQVPMLTVAGLFGLGPDLSDELQSCLIALFGSGTDSPDGYRRLQEILAGVLDEHRAAPTDDLTTAFLQHRNLRDDSERIQSMLLMLSAGWETTKIWISHTLRILLSDPRFAARMRGGRLGTDDALDKVLWVEPPMANMPARFALTDTVLGGQAIARGDALILSFAAANADSRIQPADASSATGNRGHLAWSVGNHACPAQRTGRIIARTAIDTVLRALPDASLAIPADAVTFQPSPWTRGPARLPVHATRIRTSEAHHA